MLIDGKGSRLVLEMEDERRSEGMRGERGYLCAGKGEDAERRGVCSGFRSWVQNLGSGLLCSEDGLKTSGLKTPELKTPRRNLLVQVSRVVGVCL